MTISRTVICDLCPKRCRLEPGEVGDCHIRYNHNGRLIALTYERPSAIHVDPIEKKPLFHVLPGSKAFSLATVGCNLHCLNCQNSGLSQAMPTERRAYVLNARKIVEMALRNGCKSVAATYSEPVVYYEYAVDVGRAAMEQGLKSLWITAGYIEEKPLLAAIPFISAVNLDIKFMNDRLYSQICDATLGPVLRTAELLKKHGVWVELTNLVIPGRNDSDADFRKLTSWIRQHLGPDVPLHFSRFFPHYKMRHIPPTPVDTVIRARDIALGDGLHYVYIGNARRLEFGEDTFCPKCGRPLIKRRRYRVLENHVTPQGTCPACGSSIPGVWR